MRFRLVFFWFLAGLSTAALGIDQSALERALEFVADHKTTYTSDILSLASFPTVSAHTEHIEDIKRAAIWLKKRLFDAGSEVFISSSQSEHLNI